MDDQACKKYYEEVVCVPEDLKVAASDDLHRGGDDEDEAERDNHPCNPSNGGEHDIGGSLRYNQPKNTELIT